MRGIATGRFFKKPARARVNRTFDFFHAAARQLQRNGTEGMAVKTDEGKMVLSDDIHPAWILLDVIEHLDARNHRFSANVPG